MVAKTNISNSGIPLNRSNIFKGLHAYGKRVTKITAGSHYENSYGYDGLGRVNKETEKEGTVTLMKDYTFDAGRIKTVLHTIDNATVPVLTYDYNVRGYLSDIKMVPLPFIQLAAVTILGR